MWPKRDEVLPAPSRDRNADTRTNQFYDKRPINDPLVSTYHLTRKDPFESPVKQGQGIFVGFNKADKI